MDHKERHKIRDLGQGRDWLRRTQLEEQIVFENRWIKESLVPDKHPKGVYREGFRRLSKTHPNPSLPPSGKHLVAPVGSLSSGGGGE